MTRNLTGDIPGWGALFHNNVGDGTVTVSAPEKKNYPAMYASLNLTSHSQFRS